MIMKFYNCSKSIKADSVVVHFSKMKIEDSNNSHEGRKKLSSNVVLPRESENQHDEGSISLTNVNMELENQFKRKSLHLNALQKHVGWLYTVNWES